jgi:hypothetical protein
MNRIYALSAPGAPTKHYTIAGHPTMPLFTAAVMYAAEYNVRADTVTATFVDAVDE